MKKKPFKITKKNQDCKHKKFSRSCFGYITSFFCMCMWCVMSLFLILDALQFNCPETANESSAINKSFPALFSVFILRESHQNVMFRTDVGEIYEVEVE